MKNKILVVKRIVIILIIVTLILLIPFMAMQFTTEVNWTFTDFVIAGLLLLGTLVAADYATRKIKHKVLRILVPIFLLILLLLVWAELGVGIFGLPFGGN